jgi:hypothetical protein
MKKCFFCEQEYDKLSLEHSIPQFLGGANSDEKFKKINLCRNCNSTLGLQVDARFARSFLIALNLDKVFNIKYFPMSSLDTSEKPQIEQLITNTQSIEIYFGKNASILWVKENTQDFKPLVGGNPIRAKQNSNMYIFISQSETSLSFQDIKDILSEISYEFKKIKKANFMLCIDINIASQNEHQIDLDDFLDNNFPNRKVDNRHSIKFMHEFNENEKFLADLLRPSANGYKFIPTLKEDDVLRFLSKLFLGILAGYLGNEFTEQKVGKDLISIMKTFSSDEVIDKEIMEKMNLNLKDDSDKRFSQDTISIVILLKENLINGILEIGDFFAQMNICHKNDLSHEQLDKLNMSEKFYEICNLPQGLLIKFNKEINGFEELSLQDFFISMLPNSAIKAIEQLKTKLSKKPESKFI